MSRRSQLEDFEGRRDEWEQFGIDEEYHRRLCDFCSIEYVRDSTACTAANALKAAVVEAVDRYFLHAPRHSR